MKKSITLPRIQIIIGFLLGILALTVYQYNAPVLVFAKAKNWAVEETNVSAEIEGYKIRACVPIAGSATGYMVRNNVVNEVPIKLNSPIKNRPSSFIYKVNFGKWYWNYKHKDSGVNSVLITLKYECSGKVIDQQIGPFHIPEEFN